MELWEKTIWIHNLARNHSFLNGPCHDLFGPHFCVCITLYVHHMNTGYYNYANVLLL